MSSLRNADQVLEFPKPCPKKVCTIRRLPQDSGECGSWGPSITMTGDLLCAILVGLQDKVSLEQSVCDINIFPIKKEKEV